MTTPLLRNRRHPGLPVASKLGRDSSPVAVWADDTVNTAASTVSSLTVTSGGSAHTKGAWTEIVASTSADVASITVNSTAPVGQNGIDTRCLVDIGIGGSGSETVIIPNIAVGNKSSSTAGWLFPVFIPKGTRVAFRSQHAVASTANTFRFRLGRSATPQSTKPAPYCVNMGANTSTSSGVVVSWGGSTHTKGTWTEITSAAPERLSALQVCVDYNGSVAGANGSALVDVAVGAAGSEVAVASNLFYVTTTSEQIDHFGGGLPYLPVDIPAGARVSVRYQASSNLISTLGFVLVGIPARGR